MILNLNDKEICESNASIAVSLKFLNVKNWTLVDCASAFFKLNISNDSDSIKLFRNVWTFVVIFWTCCFKGRVHYRFWKHNIVVSAFRNCWIRKVMISSFCCIIELLFSSTLRWRSFLLHRIFFLKFSECDVWASINFSSSNISFKIQFVWSNIVNYASNFSFRKMKRLKL